MDKLKPFLANLKRNQFWILSATVLIVATTVWYLATAELDEKFVRDKQKNQSAFASLEVFKTNAVNQPPNVEYKKEVEKVRTSLETQVVGAWKNLFERQRKVLAVNPRVEGLAPYLLDEKKLKEPIPAGLRDLFFNNQIIDEDFQTLFSMLNLRRFKGINPVDPIPAQAAAEFEGNLVWAAQPGPRELMLRYKTKLSPSTLRIRITQEDLWVFRSMFGVIQKINSRRVVDWLDALDGKPVEAATPDQANVPIKQIEFCDLAQYAMTAAENRPGNVRVDGDETAAPGGQMGGQAQSGFGVGTQGSEEEDQKLVEGRYLDGQNHPVPDPSSPPYTEFKQIFVQLEVIMDQRLIPVLITECANADIAIETRQLLVDMTQVDVARTVDAGEAARTLNKMEPSPHDVRVTLRGVMYGYSPPDPNNLGQGTDAARERRDYGVPSHGT